MMENNNENAVKDRKHFAIVVIILFGFLIILPWLMSFAFGDDTVKGDDEGFNEKRELTALPDSFSNDWFSRFEAFYSDHSPYRNNLILLETRVSQKYQEYYRKNITPKLIQLFHNDKNSNEGSLSGENTEPTAIPTVDMSDFNNLFGNKTPTPASASPTPPSDQTGTPSGAASGSPQGGETPSADITPTPSAQSGTPHSHDYDSGTVIRAASCSQEGEIVYKCKICGDERRESIPATAHTYKVVKTQTKDAEHYGYTLSKCSVCGYYNIEIENKTTDTSYLPPQSIGGAIFGRYDWLFYEGDNSVGYYMGTNIMGDFEMRSWMNTFENLKKECDRKGIRLVIMSAPNKEQAYPEYMPSYTVQNQTKRQDVFLDYMQKNSSVSYLYPLSDLKTAKYLYDVFYKQDTHWNAIGGFMGTMAMYRALGMETTSIFEIDVKNTRKTGGDLSNFCGYSSTYTDYEVTYKPNINVDEQYLPGSNVGAAELIQTTSDSPNKSKLVILGDSFRHSMKQYVERDFAKTTISHRSDFYNSAVQSAIKELSSGDVILLLAVERYDGQNVDMASTLTAMLRGL